MSIDTEPDKVTGRAPGHPGLAFVEIAILGFIFVIMTGASVPRLAAVYTPAPAAAVTALGEDLRSGVARAHALWLAQGQPRLVTVDGRAVRLAHGYPTMASVDAIPGRLSSFAFDERRGEFRWLGRQETTIADCGVRYAPPSQQGEAPGISVVTEGC